MKVFLGGTVNGSSWRNFVIPRLSIAYFNPVMANWTEEALERELYERRHCNFCLYVITPKLTGFYALAEVIDDSIKRPDRTIYCYLTEDGGDNFNDADIAMLKDIGQHVIRNGGYSCDSLETVIELLNNERPKNQFLSGHFVDKNHDAYISYGRHDSSTLAKEVSNGLTAQGFSIWYDDAPIPQEIEFLSQINQIIRQAHCFIFIVSHHSLNSEYCRRELEYVASLGKNIVFLSEQALSDAQLAQCGIEPNIFIQLNTNNEPQQSALGELSNHLSTNSQQLKPHTQWLNCAQRWSDGNNEGDLLLYGRQRLEAAKWLNDQTESAQPQMYTVPKALNDFINESTQQQFSKRCMYHFNKTVAPLIHHQRFDSFIGSTAVVNPLALLPQLWVLILAASSEAISVFMWLLFLFLQASSALFAIKHRNFGLCMSMFASMVITCSIVVIALLKR